MTSTQVRSAYIVASKGTNVVPLVEALDSRGVSTKTSPLILGQARIDQEIISAIRSADMVIGVLWERGPDPNVMVELGIAVGLGRSLLLFGGEGSNVPSNLRNSVVVVRMLSWNEAIFQTHLDPFLEQLSSRREQPERNTQTSSTTQPLSLHAFEAALNHLGSIESAGHTPNESEVVGLLATFFQASGYLVSIEHRQLQTGRTRPDLAVWVEDLPARVGSPLLIEVALRNAMINQRLAQFQHLLHDFKSEGGLIVTWSDTKSSGISGNPNDPRIPILSVRDLVNALKLGVFAEVYLRRSTAKS